MSVLIEPVHIEEIGDEQLEPILILRNRLDDEIIDRNVHFTMGDFRALSVSPGAVRWFFVARSEGVPVALAQGRHTDDGANPDTLLCQIEVHPDHRRSGVGTLLLGRLTELARSLGRTRLMSWRHDTVPAGEAFCRAVGATDKLVFRDSVLLIDEIDVDLLRGWVEQGHERADGYSVAVIEGPWPEQIFPGMARLYQILDRDAPRSEGVEPRMWTDDLIRDYVGHTLEVADSLMAVAIDDRTGTEVGMSHLIRRRSNPGTWIVTTTMVDPDHRGRSLGRWLKAAVNLEALNRWDSGVYQETGNAVGNDTMLRINEEMGFTLELSTTEVEVSVADATSYLASRDQVGGVPGTSSNGD